MEVFEHLPGRILQLNSGRKWTIYTFYMYSTNGHIQFFHPKICSQLLFTKKVQRRRFHFLCICVARNPNPHQEVYGRLFRLTVFLITHSATSYHFNKNEVDFLLFPRFCFVIFSTGFASLTENGHVVKSAQYSCLEKKDYNFVVV